MFAHGDPCASPGSDEARAPTVPRLPLCALANSIPGGTPLTRTRWMAVFFAVGSACFLIGPFPGYAQLVGATADGLTFFMGSILFTLGGACTLT